jgi:septum formation protein
MGKIILASSSPRRRFLLEKANLEFEVIPSPYVEDHNVKEFSYDFIEGLALGKAFAVAKMLDEAAIVIGADTVVVLNNKILGKPADKKEAEIMLHQLSGNTHSVVTGIALVNTKTGNVKTSASTSHVIFEQLTDKQIDDYIENYKPFDKAGSYGIQEMPEGYIKSYSGNLDNIIGLDVELLLSMLKNFN